MLNTPLQFYGNKILDWKVILKFILPTLNFKDEKTRPYVKNNSSAGSLQWPWPLHPEVTELNAETGATLE